MNMIVICGFIPKDFATVCHANMRKPDAQVHEKLFKMYNYYALSREKALLKNGRQTELFIAVGYARRGSHCYWAGCVFLWVHVLHYEYTGAHSIPARPLALYILCSVCVCKVSYGSWFTINANSISL